MGGGFIVVFMNLKKHKILHSNKDSKVSVFLGNLLDLDIKGKGFSLI